MTGTQNIEFVNGSGSNLQVSAKLNNDSIVKALNFNSATQSKYIDEDSYADKTSASTTNLNHVQVTDGANAQISTTGTTARLNSITFSPNSAYMDINT